MSFLPHIFQPRLFGDYAPKTFELSRTVLIIPTAKEYNEASALQYKKTTGFESSWNVNEKIHNKRRARKIKRLKKKFQNLSILSHTEMQAISKKQFDFVITEFWFYDYGDVVGLSEEQIGGFISTMHHQFKDIRNDIEYKSTEELFLSLCENKQTEKHSKFPLIAILERGI